MADITDDKKSSSTTRLVGEDENHAVTVDSDNNVHVEAHGNAPDGTDRAKRVSGIDAGNSTNTPLLADGIFIGTWFDAENYSNLSVIVFTDQDSADQGLVVEHSTDGVNVDDSDVYKIFSASGPGGSNRQFSFPLPGRYYRVKYTNGSVNQTEFRLQSKVHIERPKPSSHKIANKISDNDDVEVTKSLTTGVTPNGDYENKPICGPIDVASTSSTLAADGTFQSPIVSIKNWITLTLVLISDVASAQDGIRIEWFKDEAGTESLGEDVFTYEIVDTKRPFHLFIQGNYFRLTYINGPSAQSNFHLHTYLCDTNASALVSSLVTPLNDNLLSQLTRSVITGLDNSGDYRNVKVDSEGNLQMVAASGSSVIPTLGNNLKYDDMNASTGGVARGTAIAAVDGWVKVYDSTVVQVDASGLIMSFILNLEAFNATDPAKAWDVRLVIAGVEVFGSNGIRSTDLVNPLAYGYQDDPTKAAIEWNGLMVRGSVLRWEGPVNLPITYDSSGVQIFVRKNGDTKTFNAGFITLTRN